MEQFHIKAAAVYGSLQSGAGNPVTVSLADTVGTITSAGTAITGVSTSFTVQVAEGATLFNSAGATIGVVATVTDDANLVLVATAAVTVTAEDFSVGLGATDAIAVLNFNYKKEDTSTTETFVGGGVLDREEDVSITDSFATIDFEVLMPKLGILAGDDPVLTEVPLQEWFRSSGLAVVLSGDTSGTATLTNAVDSNEYMTIQVRRDASDGTEKLYTLSDCRGTADLTAAIASKDKVKFTFQGNLVVTKSTTNTVPDFLEQKRGALPVRKSTGNVLSEVVNYVDFNEPTQTGTTNICYDKFAIPNIAGMEYARELTSCVSNWSRTGMATDMTMTIVEDQLDAPFSPDVRVGLDHKIVLQHGTVVGARMKVVLTKGILASLPQSEVGKFLGQDLSFRNTGTTSIILS